MSELIVLFEFLIIVYLSIVLIYIHFNHVSAQEAFKIVGEKTLEYLNKLFIQENEPAPYMIDKGCLNNLLYTVCEFSILDEDYTIWNIGSYSKYNLPSVSIELCPKNGERDFNIIIKKIIKKKKKHFIEHGIRNFRIRVIFKQIDKDTYYVYILYATTNKDIKNFERLLLEYRESQKQQALNAKKPIIDPKLENELSKMEENDGEI